MRQIAINIDPGQSAGLALFEGSELIAWTTVVVKSDDSIDFALDMLSEQLPCEFILCEERGGWRGQLNAYLVGRSSGMLVALLKLHRHKPVCVTPSDWKSKILGHGRADKDAAINFCKQQWPGWAGDHNAAEACCIGLYFARYGRDLGTKKERAR